jgi:thiol-disulfide isomerase/thioredoxin
MRLATVTALLAVTLPVFAAMPPVPRPAKELVIVEPSGKQSLLTSYKGKVVYIQFLYTTCPHCQHLSQVMTKVQQDLGPKGLQVIGIAFDEADGAKAAGYQKQFNVGFPVGFASRDTVMSYLGISVMDRFVVPQVAIVDRKGVIRAQSDFMGTEQMQDEVYLRKFLGDLLKEGTTSSAAPATTAAKKAAPTTAKN